MSGDIISQVAMIDHHATESCLIIHTLSFNLDLFACGNQTFYKRKFLVEHVVCYLDVSACGTYSL